MSHRTFGLALAFLAISGCGSGVSSTEQARRAYLGLDASIDKAIQLGFDGFNAPSNGANIQPQTGVGTASGTLKVTGQVDQGSSANKGMRLVTEYTGYSDDGKLVYVTQAGPSQALGMQLKSIPTGTLDGTMAATLNMTGELNGTVTLSITFSGQLMAGTGTQVVRKPGTTHITGTAQSADRVYTIDVTR